MGLDLAGSVDTLEIFDNSKWKFYFVGNVPGCKDGTDILVFNNHILSVNTPFYSITTTNKKSGREFITGADPIGEVSVSFLETPRLTVQRILVDWKQSIFDSSSLLFNPRGGMGTGRLEIYLNNPNVPIKTLTFYNMQCVRIQDIEYTYDGGPMIVTADFIITNIGGYGDNMWTSDPTYYDAGAIDATI